MTWLFGRNWRLTDAGIYLLIPSMVPSIEPAAVRQTPGTDHSFSELSSTPLFISLPYIYEFQMPEMKIRRMPAEWINSEMRSSKCMPVA